jgi:hypothetical protein
MKKKKRNTVDFNRPRMEKSYMPLPLNTKALWKSSGQIYFGWSLLSSRIPNWSLANPVIL